MFLTILHISCCYPVFLIFPSLYSLPLLCIDLKFTFLAAALSLCSPLFVFHGIALLCLPLLFLIPSDVFSCHLLSLPPPPTLFSHVPVFQCFCFSVPAFRSSCFSVFLFLCSCFSVPCFSVSVFRCSCFPVSLFLFSSALFLCSCFQMFLFSHVPVFLCLVFQCLVFQCLVSLFQFSYAPVFQFPVSWFLFSSALFLCSCFQMLLLTSAPVSLFLFSDVPVSLFLSLCFFPRCSCFPLFLSSSVPVFQCSCSSVFAVRTLRPVGLGCVDGTKTVASWSYLWEKTGYSLVHSDIQVCTYHTRQN